MLKEHWITRWSHNTRHKISISSLAYWTNWVKGDKVLKSPTWLAWPLWNIYVTNDHGYVPVVVNTYRSFHHSWLITGFVTILTRRVPIVEQELRTLPDHLSSSPMFSGVHVARYLVLCVCCFRSLLAILSFFFWTLCCLSFFDWHILITSVVSSNTS